MQAIKLALAMMCICLGMGIVNSLGITQIYDAPMMNDSFNITKADGIMEVKSGSSDDVADSLLGWTAVFKVWGIFKDFVTLTILPGSYITSHGGNPYVAVAVQIAMNAIVFVGAFQIITKINLKGME